MLLALLLFRLLLSRCCHSLAATVLVASCQIAQRMFGGVCPFSFFCSCFSLKSTSLATLSCAGAPTACSAVRPPRLKNTQVPVHPCPLLRPPGKSEALNVWRQSCRRACWCDAVVAGAVAVSIAVFPLLPLPRRYCSRRKLSNRTCP